MELIFNQPISPPSSALGPEEEAMAIFAKSEPELRRFNTFSARSRAEVISASVGSGGKPMSICPRRYSACSLPCSSMSATSEEIS